MSIEDTPSIILPEKSGIYKHIQVVIGGKDFIRFETEEYIHGEILEELLKKTRTEFQVLENMDGENIPLEKGSNYELVGAGWINLDLENKEGIFYKFSRDYQKRTSEAHLERIRKKLNDWKLKKE